MQCENCGRPLQPHETICPNCGEPAVRERPAGRGVPVSATSSPKHALRTGGPPADFFAPTIYGAPGGGPRADEMSDASAPTWDIPTDYRYGGYRAAPPEPPRRHRRARWLYAFAALIAVVLVLALSMEALAASGQRIAGIDVLLGHTASSTPTVHTSQTAVSATSTPATTACQAPTVDPSAAQMLSQTQLSTGVRDAASRYPDLRPVDDVSTFAPGQYVYVTFQIATNDTGTLTATFCVPGMPNESTADKSVPAGSLNALGEFHLLQPLTASNAGRGLVVLTWNGAVAAVLPFTESQD